MRRRALWLTLFLTPLVATCGKEAPGPSGPSPGVSFLEGAWSGTLTIERAGEPTSSGPVTWTFKAVDGTNLQSFTVTIQSQHPWLPITTTVSSAITPSNQPPARVSTQGDYRSPRGCTGSLLSVANADARTIEGDFAGVDCLTVPNSTFTGRVTLMKVG